MARSMDSRMALSYPRAMPDTEIDSYRFWRDMAELPFVEAIWLYGSRARGDHRPRADIDLAVDAPGADARQWDRVLELAENADTLLHVDCVRLDAAEPEFRARLMRGAIPLFRRAR
jgi:predicted nucleotidyltransferase